MAGSWFGAERSDRAAAEKASGAAATLSLKERGVSVCLLSISSLPSEKDFDWQ